MSTNTDNISVINNAIEEEEDTQKDKYLSFIIDNEYYVIEIKDVIEILEIQKITEVPNIEKHIKGVINLRGIITPVINVRIRFGIQEIEYNNRTCIIVIDTKSGGVGIIVDEVAEVLSILGEDISPAPSTNKGSKSRFIRGIGKVNGSLKIVLDLNNLLYEEKIEVDE